MDRLQAAREQGINEIAGLQFFDWFTQWPIHLGADIVGMEVDDPLGAQAKGQPFSWRTADAQGDQVLMKALWYAGVDVHRRDWEVNVTEGDVYRAVLIRLSPGGQLARWVWGGSR
jgi:hypothetical protein